MGRPVMRIVGSIKNWIKLESVYIKDTRSEKVCKVISASWKEVDGKKVIMLKAKFPKRSKKAYTGPTHGGPDGKMYRGDGLSEHHHGFCGDSNCAPS